MNDRKCSPHTLSSRFLLLPHLPLCAQMLYRLYQPRKPFTSKALLALPPGMETPTPPPIGKTWFLTTVGSGLDGTISGNFSYPCPQVTPHSPFYFYRFISPNAGIDSFDGTGRFAIVGSDGIATPPANPTQPYGENIPWDIGVNSLILPSPPLPLLPILRHHLLRQTLNHNLIFRFTFQ